MHAKARGLLAIVYGRVSTEEQERRGYSLPEQLHRCLQRLAAEVKMPVEALRVSEAVDDVVGRPDDGVLTILESEPGDVLERPGLQRLIALARTWRPQYVVCLHPDRWSRDLYIQLDVHRQVEAAGVKLIFAEVDFDNSPEGRLYFQMLGAISEFTKRRILATTERGRIGKLRQGGFPWCVAPYGYRWDKERHWPVPDALDERGEPIPGTPAAVVRQIFQWAAEGVGCGSIARRLNGEEPGYSPVPPPGKADKRTIWYARTVGSILSNPIYRGEAIVRRTNQVGARKRRYLPPEDRPPAKLPRPPEEWFHISVQPIVPEELWYAAQAAREAARRRRDGRAKYFYLCSGLVVCGLCGQPMAGYPGRSRNGSLLLYYYCHGRLRKRRTRFRWRSPANDLKPCDAPGQRADGPNGVDAMVWAEVRRWLEDPEAWEEAARRWREDQRPLEDPSALEAQAARILEQHARLLRAYQAGVIEDEAAALAELGRLKREADRLRQEAAALRRALEASREEDLLATMAELREVLDEIDADPIRRREVVRALVRQVIVTPGQPPVIVPVV